MSAIGWYPSVYARERVYGEVVGEVSEGDADVASVIPV